MCCLLDVTAVGIQLVILPSGSVSKLSLKYYAVNQNILNTSDNVLFIATKAAAQKHILSGVNREPNAQISQVASSSYYYYYHHHRPHHYYNYYYYSNILNCTICSAVGKMEDMP